jgi:hypothetical protein
MTTKQEMGRFNGKHTWWRLDANRKSGVALPTYGTYGTCWASGPAYKKCIPCDSDEYRAVSRNNYILDSQTIAEKLGKNHETAKANCKQNWHRMCGARFSYENLRMMLARKHKHIQDAEERERMISQELWEFMDEYEFVTQDRRAN